MFYTILIKNLWRTFLGNIWFRTYIILQTLSRVLLCLYAIYNKQINLIHLPFIFPLGFFNDLVSIIYFIPLILFNSILFHLCFKKHSQNLYKLSLVAYATYVFILLFSLLAEIIFWDEYGTKFNFIAVDYLIYTQEIIHTVKDSLPVGSIIITMSILTILVTIMMRKKLAGNIKINLYSQLVVICLILASLCSKHYSSNATFFSQNRYANELTLNGPYEFFKAFLTNSLDYSKFYPNIDSKTAISVVRNNVLEPNQEFLDIESLLRVNISNSKNISKYNIVLITVESLSAEFLKHFGNQHDITPNIDKLIKDSLVFNNIYAVGTRTVRGLEALTLSIPPTPGSSIIRRPNNSNLFNIGNIFKREGYQVKFIFGGYSYFDNLWNFFTNNGFEILDRSDLKKEEISFSNIWGVADEDILKKTLESADQAAASSKPFFYLVMTTTNHRPYTFPSNKIDLPSGSGRNAAVKYTDYAIGKFLEEARKKDWFNNTIFIITADHCASSAGKTALPLHKYHIPLIIYAPKIIKPGKVDHLASQIDIPPTILGLTNFNYISKFYGKNILNSPPNRAFISTYQLMGYYKDNKMIVLAPNKEVEQFKLENKQLINEEVDNDLASEAISYYQSAYELYRDGKLIDDTLKK